MDTEWMRERLDAFVALCARYDMVDRSTGNYWTPQHQQIANEATSLMPTVRRILDTLQDGLGDEVKQPQYLGGMMDSLRACQQGLGILADRDEWVVRLAPVSPSLPADRFHPHVWGVASVLWDTGQYRVAVQQAATSLSSHIASRVSSKLVDRELVAQTFSPNEPGLKQMRLQFRGDKNDRTWRSRQDGLHLVAQGAFAGIRNVATHTDEEWSEQVALEHLAVLSVVARWADETEVVSM